MNILIITINYFPEIGGIARITTELSESLKKCGHEVTVVTAFPHHPYGIVSKEYRGKLLQREEFNGIKLIRTYIYASPKKHFLTRILNYGSFTVTSVLGGLLSGKHDVVFTMFPPPLLGISAYLVSKVKQVPVVLNVEDIWPDGPVALGEIKNKYLIKFLEAVERFVYKKAERILVISKGFKRDIENKGIDADKIDVAPNWVDIDFITPGCRKNSIREKYSLDDKFVVMFAGTIGLAQGLECVIDAAKLLSHQKDILFVFVGEGVMKKKLQQKAEEYALENVMFIPVQPREYIPKFLAAADVCLVTLQRKPVFAITIPCKTYEIMAAARPVIINVEGDARELVEEANCGIAIEPENPKQLAEAIIKLYGDDELRLKLGQNGRNYVVKHYSIDTIIKLFETTLRKTISNTL